MLRDAWVLGVRERVKHQAPFLTASKSRPALRKTSFSWEEGKKTLEKRATEPSLWLTQLIWLGRHGVLPETRCSETNTWPKWTSMHPNYICLPHQRVRIKAQNACYTCITMHVEYRIGNLTRKCIQLWRKGIFAAAMVRNSHPLADSAVQISCRNHQSTARQLALWSHA